MPAAVKALFARKLLKKVAEAYGRMLLIKGLFQADCHPGNILIRDDNGLGMPPQDLGATSKPFHSGSLEVKTDFRIAIGVSPERLLQRMGPLSLLPETTRLR